MNKNIALVIAGGIGARMNNAIPKQFITVFDKPIIIYTLEKFQNHPSIDAIFVVCVDGWENIISSYAKQYSIFKLQGIVKGGRVGQESIKNGLIEISKHYDKDSIVLIHDAIRPNVSADIISECLNVTRKYGNAITSIPCQEAMLVTEDGLSSSCIFSRDKLKRTQTPQGFYLSKLLDIHKKAEQLNISNSIASCTLMIEVGEKVYFSNGSEKNLKLTTPEDIDIFKALLSENK